MDNLNCVAQGDPSQQCQVTELVLRAIKTAHPSLPGELKDSVSIKKALAGDGNWSLIKEILGWVLNTTSGTLHLSDKRRRDLKKLLTIPHTQLRLSRKKLKRLIGKLRLIQLAVLGVIRHFYHLQMALTRTSPKTAYLSKSFHEDVQH